MPAILRARHMAALPVLIVAILVATMLGAAPSADAATRKQRIQHAFSVALDQRGDRYQYGASGPNRFDCSGLIYFSFRKAGIRNVPRTSSAQARHAKRIQRSNLRTGDLVFFHDGAARPGNVYHVGIFAGWSKGRRIVLHSPSTGERVHRSPIWTRSWFAGTLR
jgi:cell wall-associated NlpC family hydrolase